MYLRRAACEKVPLMNRLNAMKRLGLALVLAGVLAVPATASAITLRTPANGATVREDSVVEFGWEQDYDLDSAGSVRLYIGRTVPPEADPVFTAENEVFANYVFVLPYDDDLTPGDYFWRACAYHDDLSNCELSEVRSVRIQHVPVARMDRGAAEYNTERALVRRFGRWVEQNGRYNCRRSSSARFVCRPSRWVGDISFKGKFVVSYDRHWRSHAHVRGSGTFTNHYCLAVKKRNCRKRHRFRVKVS